MNAYEAESDSKPRCPSAKNLKFCFEEFYGVWCFSLSSRVTGNVKSSVLALTDVSETHIDVDWIFEER